MTNSRHINDLTLAVENLKNSENFNDPSADWHISRQQMAKTSLALDVLLGPLNHIKTFKTSSNKYISINHYARKGEWIKNALINQLKMSDEHAEKLALLIERSALKAADFSDQDWQEYYEHSRNKQKNDQSWAITVTEMQEIVAFLKKGISINTDYCVPYYAGLSDDKKTIYFDRSIQQNISTTLALGSISPIDYVVLHERVEGAMMEQSYLDQLKSGKKEIKFECPFYHEDKNTHEKMTMKYQLIGEQLKLTYQVTSSTQEKNALIENMTQQAIKQGVLSYEFGHQIAERLERVAIFARGFGEIWEDQYNFQVMIDIEKLAKEYELAYEKKTDLPKETPPNLYLGPYAQETENTIEMYLLQMTIKQKLQHALTEDKNLSNTKQTLFATNSQKQNTEKTENKNTLAPK